jgi:hypothetical protein
MWITALLPLVAMMALWGCTEESHDVVLPPDGGGGGPEEQVATCLGCHSSEAKLKAALGDKSPDEILVHHKDDG